MPDGRLRYSYYNNIQVGPCWFRTRKLSSSRCRPQTNLRLKRTSVSARPSCPSPRLAQAITPFSEPTTPNHVAGMGPPILGEVLSQQHHPSFHITLPVKVCQHKTFFLDLPIILAGFEQKPTMLCLKYALIWSILVIGAQNMMEASERGQQSVSRNTVEESGVVNYIG
jgi:hypothetical protein